MNDLAKGNLNVKVVIGIVGATIVVVGAFYKVVVLPINNMQIQLAEIQKTLADSKASSDQLSTHVSDLDSRISRLEDKSKK